MRGVISVLALLLGPNVAMAQERTSDPVSAAMAALNVVLPREAEQELALSAAPAHLRAGAAVYVYGTRGFERVRTGSNGFSCLVNRDAFFYGASAFKPTCWDATGQDTYLPVMLKVGELLASGASQEAIVRAIDAGFAAGTYKRPSGGGVAYMLAGDVMLDPRTGRVTRQLYPGHYMFYAAGATSAQLGFSADGARSDATLPFVFSGGAGGAHGLSYIITVRHAP
ncbi:MAG: hypothetical protein K2Y26_13995 [Gemmatimonadaceae bacterium]|jgi:hypothetical protein|nr:hypothetical protein [Gemmatimonadaceae bacterium]